MTNISQQLCKICGIEPKRNRVTTQGLSGIHLPDLYPNFEKPENFIKLLELNIKEYNKTLVNLATPYFVFNNRKSLLSLIVNSFKNNTQFARFYFKDIKQAIKSEEWVYG